MSAKGLFYSIAPASHFMKEELFITALLLSKEEYDQNVRNELKGDHEKLSLIFERSQMINNKKYNQAYKELLVDVNEFISSNNNDSKNSSDSSSDSDPDDESLSGEDSNFVKKAPTLVGEVLKKLMKIKKEDKSWWYSKENFEIYLEDEIDKLIPDIIVEFIARLMRIKHRELKEKLISEFSEDIENDVQDFFQFVSLNKTEIKQELIKTQTNAPNNPTITSSNYPITNALTVAVGGGAIVALGFIPQGATRLPSVILSIANIGGRVANVAVGTATTAATNVGVGTAATVAATATLGIVVSTLGGVLTFGGLGYSAYKYAWTRETAMEEAHAKVCNRIQKAGYFDNSISAMEITFYRI